MRDEAAFAVLVGRYGRLVLNVCRSVLGDEHDAEEAAQGTFLVLARRANSLRDREVLAGWLHGVAYRTSLRARRDVNRRRAREARQRPARVLSPPGPADEVAWRETQAIVDEELQRLPERLRTPFVLCYQEGLAHAEAARRLGCKTGTVSSRLHEARKRLCRRLERRGVSLSAVPGGLTLADGMTRAALPAARVAETVAAALQFVKGEAAGPAGKLAGAELRGALWTRMWAATIVTTAAGALGIVAGEYLRSPAAPTAPQPVAGQLTPLAVANRPRPDRFGDVLPEDAIPRPEINPIGHDFSIESTVWSPDGKIIATLAGGSEARPVSLWDAFTGRILHQFAAKEVVDAAAFSPDGKTLAAAAGKRGIVLWDVVSGRELRCFTGQGEGAAVAFAPDGRTLAAAGRTGVIQIREMPSGRLVAELKASVDQSVKSVAYAPDSKSLASTGDDGAVILWDLSRGTERWRRKPHGDRAYGVAFAPDGKAFATTGADNVIRVWDTSSGESLWSPSGNPVRAGSAEKAMPNGVFVAYSPDGRTLASGGPGSVIRLWDPSTGKGRGQRPTGRGAIKSLSYSPDGRALATTDELNANRVRFWDPETWRDLYSAVGHNAPVYGLSFSPDGKTVWSAARYEGVFRGDLASGKVQQLPGLQPDGYGYFEPIAFSRDGRTVATGSRDGSIGLWDTSGRPLATLTGHTGGVITVAFSPDCKVLASSGADHTVRFWDVVTNRALGQARTPDCTWGCLAFSPDSRKLALARGEEFNRLPLAPIVLEIVTRKEVLRLECPAPGPDPSDAPNTSDASREFVTFSPDGRTLATSGKYRDAVVRLWDAATGELIGRCRRERNYEPSYLSFSPDGRLLATGPYERPYVLGTWLSLWDVASFQEVASLAGQQGGATALAFSPDGRCVATGASDGTVRVFDLSGPRVVGHGNDTRMALVWDLTSRTGSGHRRTSHLSPSVNALEHKAARELLHILASTDGTTPLAREARAALDRLNTPD